MFNDTEIRLTDIEQLNDQLAISGYSVIDNDIITYDDNPNDRIVCTYKYKEDTVTTHLYYHEDRKFHTIEEIIVSKFVVPGALMDKANAELHRRIAFDGSVSPEVTALQISIAVLKYTLNKY